MSSNPFWKRDADAKPSYLGVMLKSQLNLNAGLVSVIAATLLSFPFGLAGAILPLIAFGAGEAIAALFIPSSPLFRAQVDREHRAVRRDQALQYLSQQILQRVGADDYTWPTFERMGERIQSLREIARHRQSSINETDLERIEDARVDFLSLWLANLTMADRIDSINAPEIEHRVSVLTKRIDSGDPERRNLSEAKADLEELLLRQRRLGGRKAAVEAALLSMPDAVEEIYQAAIATPASGQGGDHLQEAIDRLRVEEELEHAYSGEIDQLLASPTPVAKVPAAKVAAAKRQTT